MFCGIVLCVILAKPDAASAPSHVQVAEAVLAGRQKVKTLQVRSYCRRLLTRREMRSELFLDQEMKRWRFDTTLLGPPGESLSSGEEVTYSQSTSANGEVVYSYRPTRPELVARIDLLQRALRGRHIAPFRDPRNAGLVPVPYSHTGTPFEIGGGRTSLYSFCVNFCLEAEQAAVVPVAWKGQQCWKVKSSSHIKDATQGVCTYIVAPEMGHSVVFMEYKCYYNDETEPGDVASVESDITLHKKSGIWFPSQVRYLQFSQGKKIKEEITDFEVVSLNQPIPEDVFTFAGMGVPVGHRVMDVTKDSADAAIWDGEKVVRLRAVPPLADSETGQTK